MDHGRSSGRMWVDDDKKEITLETKLNVGIVHISLSDRVTRRHGYVGPPARGYFGTNCWGERVLEARDTRLRKKESK